MHEGMKTMTSFIDVAQSIPAPSLRALCAAVLDAAEQFYADANNETNENKEVTNG